MPIKSIILWNVDIRRCISFVAGGHAKGKMENMSAMGDKIIISLCPLLPNHLRHVFHFFSVVFIVYFLSLLLVCLNADFPHKHAIKSLIVFTS